MDALLDKFTDRIYETFYAILSVTPEKTRSGIVNFIEDVQKS